MMSADLLFVILAGIFLFAGLVGAFVPVLPGPPLAWLGLLCARFSEYTQVPVWILVVTGIVALAVTVLDNILPVAMTKKSGGSSYGNWGCSIGLVLGLFSGPPGILLCPFLGALVGELIHDSSDFDKCLHAAIGAFKGFLFGVGLKTAASAAFIWIFVYYIAIRR